ncbi:MAG: Nif3-like dinuclear metal center hexameric protein [Clostridia bacterium]|nr:Nif3-like dinuclear metal center hexameric protein [Clostridia bacterium]
MTVYELNKYMNQRIPRELSCSWDNDGLMCCPDGTREVKNALFCMDVTPEAIDYAIVNGYDLIISHHPLIFKGVKSVSGDFGIPSRIIKLIKNDISVMSFHTRFDAVDGGVNDALAELFELSEVEKVECDGIELMRVGTLNEEMDIEHFVTLVCEKLGCEHLNFASNSGKVHRLALVGGGGGSYIKDAYNAGADTYLSGEIGYHNLTDCKDYHINLVEAGHYFTENPSLKNLAKFVLEADNTIKCDFFETNIINHI